MLAPMPYLTGKGHPAFIASVSEKDESFVCVYLVNLSLERLTAPNVPVIWAGVQTPSREKV